MTDLFWLFVGNLGRRLLEASNRRLQDRTIIDEIRKMVYAKDM